MSSDFLSDPSGRLSRREVLAGLAMAGAAGLVVARKPDIKLNYLGDRKLDQVLPDRIGRWKFVGTSGLIIPPNDQLALALYSQTITRVYYDGNVPVMLLIAYSASQTGFLQVHRPEFCYTAAGFTLSDFQRHEVALDGHKTLSVNTLSAMRDGGGEKLLYWVRIGNHVPLSWAQQKLVFAEDNLRRLVPDSALVRVSTPLGSEGPSMSVLNEFVRSMVEATPAPLRRVLVP
jgi:EpsI family protein